MKDVVSIEKYSELLLLQENINAKLRSLFEANKKFDRAHLAELLVNEIENIVDDLNAGGRSFGRCDYGGDIDYENSEQTYSDGPEMGLGIVLHFHGFSVQASWNGNVIQSKRNA